MIESNRAIMAAWTVLRIYSSRLQRMLGLRIGRSVRGQSEFINNVRAIPMQDSKEIIITDEATAFNAIQTALQDGFAGQSVNLKFKNWPILEIVLKGEEYNSNITSDMASALVQLQTSMNRTYALLAHGQNSSAHLTDDERHDIQFKASVKPGSSLIQVDLGEYAEKLVTATIGKMTPEQLIITVVSISVIAASVVAYKAYLKTTTENKKISELGRTAIAMSEQETARQKILADALTSNKNLVTISRNFDDAKNQIIKGTSDADSLTVNAVLIDQETAKLAVTKTREAAVDIQLNGSYFVTETNLKKSDEIRLGLRRAQDGKEFVASFYDNSLDKVQITLLQEAEWGRSTVFLSINATELRGQITSAKVVSVTAQPV